MLGFSKAILSQATVGSYYLLWAKWLEPNESGIAYTVLLCLHLRIAIASKAPGWI